MTITDIKRYGIIVSLNTEIEAMKIANIKRGIRDLSPAYTDDDFFAMSDKIKEVLLCPETELDKYIKS